MKDFIFDSGLGGRWGTYLGMDISKNEKVRYVIGTNEMAQCFNNTVNGTILHHYLINFTVVSIVKSTFNPFNAEATFINSQERWIF